MAFYRLAAVAAAAGMFAAGALLALDVGDEADAASVVFIGRVIQTLGRRRRRRDGEGMLFHGDLPRL